jgi:ATP-binding cassette subfamily G (WHITE) protein 2 (SNQ2)
VSLLFHKFTIQLTPSAVVLGRPGSGCSTLLKTLTNQTDEYHSVTGNVRYDAISPVDIRAHYRGDVQYCPEDDLHFPTLSVEQTIQFATRLRAPQAKARMVGQSRTEYIDSMVEMLLTIFGLREVRSTPVGDSVVRGISGGQKKRVSIAEALATRMRIGAWDKYRQVPFTISYIADLVISLVRPVAWTLPPHLNLDAPSALQRMSVA